jgi:hypothetical protein
MREPLAASFAADVRRPIMPQRCPTKRSQDCRRMSDAVGYVARIVIEFALEGPDMPAELLPGSLSRVHQAGILLLCRS